MTARLPAPEHRAELARHFRQFASDVFAGSSPLYARLSAAVAEDEDLLALLPPLLATIPRSQTLCVFHSFVLNQLPSAERDRLDELLLRHATGRDLFRVSLEWLSGSQPQLQLMAYSNGVKREQLLGYAGQHGEWLDWLQGA